MQKIIEVKGLKKSYGSIEAVKGIDFYMEEGTLFSFLGVNGAGKSTTIDMITTFLKPDEGEVMLASYRLGSEDQQIRKCIGAVFQNNLLDDELSVYENLQTRCSLYGMSREERKRAIDHAIQLCDLSSLLKQRYGKLSGGQRRRCDIARALLHSPKLLFLDEPTTGLDPQTRKLIWDVITKLRMEEGMSVFLTTHYMEEAAQSDYIVVMDEGRICAKGTPQALKMKYASDHLTMYCEKVNEVEHILNTLEIVYTQKKEEVHIALQNTMDAMPILMACSSLINDFEVVHGTMDDAFLKIVGKEL